MAINHSGLRGIILKLLSILVFYISMLGCTTHYTAEVTREVMTDLKLRDDYQVERTSDWVLHHRSRIFLARAINTSPSTEVDAYPRLRNAIVEAMAESIAQVFTVEVSPNTQTVWQALEYARGINAQILLYPSLSSQQDAVNSVSEYSHGEDLAYDKDFGLDSVLVKIIMLEVQSGEILDVATVRGISQGFAISASMPRSLLPAAARKYTEKISGIRL